MKAGPKIAKTARTLAVVTAVIYGAFLLINLVLQGFLNSQLLIRDTHIETIERNAHIENQVKKISKVTKLYKDTRLQNPDVADSLEQIAKALESTVSIKSLSYKRDNLTYAVLAEANRATSFALLIAQLLESEDVESITLDYVEYLSGNRKYSASLELQMR